MSIKQFRPPTTAGIYYTLPAVSGIQAGREYFIAMCPLSLVPRLFPMMIDQSRPELHLQRILNPSRVPEIALPCASPKVLCALLTYGIG